MEYNYCKLPVNLIYLLDSDCIKAMAYLIQQESYWRNNNRLKDGYFYKSMEEIARVFRVKNKQDVRLIIQTLRDSNLIEVKTSKGGRYSNYYRINWDRICELSSKTIEDTLNGEMIRAAKRGRKSKSIKLEYCFNEEDNRSEIVQNCTTIVKEDSTNTYYQSQNKIVQGCTTTKDNINKNKKNNNSNTNNNYVNSTISLIENERYSMKYPSKLNFLFEDSSGRNNFILKYKQVIDYLKTCEEDECGTIISYLIDWLPRQNELGNIPYNYIEKYMSEAKQVVNNRYL